MDENLSQVSPAGQILSVKNEEDEQRVKRRRVLRKPREDGGSVQRSDENPAGGPGHCGIYAL